MSLDGTWELELGGETLPIEVPFTFEAPLSGIGRSAEVHERVRYRRTFMAPWRARTLLCFGAVDWRCQVRLDGRSVGGHTGGYTHFRLDLGDLEPGREYELVVDVEDPAGGGQPKGKQRGSDGGIWYARTTGIWQPVFNLARMHVKIADPRWYALCDRLGLLVAQDIPSSHDLSTEAWRENFARETAEIVAQLRGHPCIVMWIAFNEDWGEPPPDFQRRIVRETRAADPSRLVVDASGWKQLDDTDLRDVHDYGDDLSAHVSPPDLPLWIGECGGVSLPARGYVYKSVESPEELRAERERLVGTLGDVAGFVWTQLADVEEERNGLLRADRVPKL